MHADSVAYLGIAASEKDFDLLRIYPGLPPMRPINPLQPTDGYSVISPTRTTIGVAAAKTRSSSLPVANDAQLRRLPA